MKKKTPTVRSEPARRSAARRPASKAPRATDQVADPRIRLNKLLAQNGIASRRKADQLITEGEVMIDGEIVTELGLKVDPAVQRVEVDGVVLKPEGERHRYYLLNKPTGVVCTNDHREARPRAVDLITDKKKGRIYTVGRLDEETVGLVILTNDGEFANRISHPRYGVKKTYRVVVNGRVEEGDVKKMRTGVRLSDFKASFQRVRVHRRTDRQSTLFVTLHEGKNREVRRVFARLGLPVKSLSRVEIGDLNDRGLKVGHWRPLTRSEVTSLLRSADQPGATLVPRPRRRREPEPKQVRRRI